MKRYETVYEILSMFINILSRFILICLIAFDEERGFLSKIELCVQRSMFTDVFIPFIHTDALLNALYASCFQPETDEISCEPLT